MGSYFSKCWESRPNRGFYTRLGRLLVWRRKDVVNEDEYLTLSTFAALGDVIALDEMTSAIPPPLTLRDHEENMLMHDAAIHEMLYDVTTS